MAYHILMDRRTHSVSEYIILLWFYMQHFANASLTEDLELGLACKSSIAQQASFMVGDVGQCN